LEVLPDALTSGPQLTIFGLVAGAVSRRYRHDFDVLSIYGPVEISRVTLVVTRSEAVVKSSNPVLGRLNDRSRGQTSYQGPAQQQYGGGFGAGYGRQSGPVLDMTRRERAMTLDDVVVRTIALVALVIVTAAFSWNVLKFDNALTAVAMIGSSIAGIVLVFVISFRRIVNPWLIGLYAVLQGVLLGVMSREFEHAYPGVVVQAVAATMAVFFGMAVLYRFRVIRATPRFARWVVGALIGVVGLSLINWVLHLFGHNLGIEYYSPTQNSGTVAIIFALICIGVGALTFILDFDLVEQSVRHGLPERFAWYCAFGMVVGLIYLYWQILRLLGYLRN
jgi:uncharacterized YccA/Bax inhibitor family protein